MNTLVATLLFCLLALTTLVQGQTLPNAPTGIAVQLGSLDFGRIFGNPLAAVVEAMRASAEKTADFIVNVGMEEVAPAVGGGPPVYHLKTIDFYYETIFNGNLSYRKMEMPFLYLVPIPYLQIDSVSISLNVQMNSLSNTTTQKNTQCTGTMGNDPRCRLQGFYGLPRVVGGTSSQSQTKTALNIKKEYHLDVQLRASSASMPGGMARVLDLFEAITRASLNPIIRTNPTPTQDTRA